MVEVNRAIAPAEMVSMLRESSKVTINLVSTDITREAEAFKSMQFTAASPPGPFRCRDTVAPMTPNEEPMKTAVSEADLATLKFMSTPKFKQHLIQSGYSELDVNTCATKAELLVLAQFPPSTPASTPVDRHVELDSPILQEKQTAKDIWRARMEAGAEAAAAEAAATATNSNASTPTARTTAFITPSPSPLTMDEEARLRAKRRIRRGSRDRVCHYVTLSLSLCHYVTLSLSLCPSVSVTLSLSLSLSVALALCLCHSVTLSLSLCLCLCLWLWLCAFVTLCLYQPSRVLLALMWFAGAHLATKGQFTSGEERRKHCYNRVAGW